MNQVILSIAEWLTSPHAVTLSGWVWLIVIAILTGGVAALLFALSFIQAIFEVIIGAFWR